MPYTSHGHHIPGTLTDDKKRAVARCSAFTGCHVCQQDEVNYWAKNPLGQEKVSEPKVNQPSALDLHMRAYADRLQKIYDDRTAGDASFLGVLSQFLQEITHDGDLLDPLVGRFMEINFAKTQVQVVLQDGSVVDASL